MPWAWHDSDADRVGTSNLVSVVVFGNRASAVSRAIGELRARQLNERLVYPGALPGLFLRWPIETSERTAYGYRGTIFGFPYRPWVIGRLRQHLRTVSGDAGLRVVVADTGSSTTIGLLVDLASESNMGLADSFGQLGEGVIDGTSSAARGAGNAIRGVGDATEGLGDAIQSTGEGLRSAGAASRFAPGLTTALVVVAGLGVFLVSTGALKFKAVRIR